MDDFEAPRGGKLIQAARAAPEVSGEAAAAQKNRQTEARLGVIDAFGRLGIRHDRWPDFVRAFSTDPQQRTTYNALMTPRPCQPPEFDRLNQSYKDWVRLADRGWRRIARRSWKSGTVG